MEYSIYCIHMLPYFAYVWQGLCFAADHKDKADVSSRWVYVEFLWKWSTEQFYLASKHLISDGIGMSEKCFSSFKDDTAQMYAMWKIRPLCLLLRCWAHRFKSRRTPVTRTALGRMQVWSLKRIDLASLWPTDPQPGELFLTSSVLQTYHNQLNSSACHIKLNVKPVNEMETLDL